MIAAVLDLLLQLDRSRSGFSIKKHIPRHIKQYNPRKDSTRNAKFVGMSISPRQEGVVLPVAAWLQG
jgi:hypothetical protein